MWIYTLGVVICFSACALTAPSSDSLTTEKLRSKRSLDFVHLRHSRFPHLDRVMTKIDNLKNERSNEGVRLRHWRSTTTEKTDMVFENYFDDADKEENQIDDIWDEYENDEEYDEDYENEMFPDWQGEEPTTTTMAPVRKSMSPISELKWQMYGTRNKVIENREKELYSLATDSSAMLARNHNMRVKMEGSCKNPLPRVVSVQNEHPNARITYTPHCTVLHRCAEDTGCCPNHHMKCGPKTQEIVHLHVFVKNRGYNQAEIVKLPFINHTKCACFETPSLEPSTDDINSIDSSTVRNSCNCPKSFQPVLKNKSKCTCDCDRTSPECIRMKNGLEYFSLADRKCVLENNCGPPICEYGGYIRLKGRCPNKNEKLKAFELVNI